jgi:hypothetical protein
MRPRIWLLLLVLCLLPACGSDDNPAKPKPGPLASLAGAWDLRNWTYSRVDSPSIQVDWVVQDTLSGALTIQESGAFTVSPALPGGGGTDFGTLTVQADSIYWDGENDEQWVGFTRSEPFLTLEWRESELVDMDHDGQPESVYLTARYERR